MAENKNDSTLMGRKPNSLDRIASDSSSHRSYRSDLLLMEQRGRIETVEMQRVRSELESLMQQRDELRRQVQRAKSGVDPVSESLFTAMGFSKEQARTTIQTIPARSMRAAIERAQVQYEENFTTRSSGLYSQLEKLKEARQIDAARLFEQHVISRISRPREGARAMMFDPALASAAEKYAELSTPSNISRGIERVSRAREVAGIKLAEAAKNVQTVEGRERFSELEREYHEKRFKELSLEEAQKKLVRGRRATESLIERGERTAEQIAGRQGMESIRAGVKTGEFGTAQQVMQKLKISEEAFISSLAKMREEFEKTGKVTAATREEYEKVGAEYDKQNKILKEITSSGGGRFGGANRIASIGDLAGRGMDLAGYLAVGLQSEKMGMRIGMAGAMNQRNADIFAATQGNMSALRRLTEGQFEKAVNFSGEYAGRANAIGGVGALVDIGTGAAGAAAAAGGAFPWSLSGGSVASNLTSGVRSGARILGGVTGAETQLQFFQQFNQLKDVINDIPDASKQAFFDYRQNALMSMRGAGQRTSAMYDEAVSTATMMQMAAMGVSPTETNRLFGVGINAIGSSFVRDPSAARQMVARGAELQASGYMSAEDYLQRVGQAAALGGGQKDIEEVLARAVTRGVDDARSLNNLFTVIGSLARSGVSPGTPSIGATAGAVSSMMGMLKDLPIDETLKQALVASELQRSSEITSQSGIDIPSMTYINAMKKLYPDMEPMDLGNIKSTSLLEQVSKMKLVSSFKAGDQLPESIMFALGKAAGPFVDGTTFKGIQGEDFFGSLVEKGLDPIRNRLLNETDIKYATDYMRGADPTGLSRLSKKGAAAIRDVRGTLIANRALITAAYEKDLPLAPLPGLTGEAAATQSTFGIQAGGLAKQVLAGQSFYEQLGEQARLAGGGGPLQPPYAGATQAPMSYVATMMGRQLEEFSPEKAGKEAAQAAEKMTLDSSEFDKSVTNFSAAVDKLVKAVEPLGVNLSQSINYGYSNMGALADPDAYGAYLQEFQRNKRALYGR